MNDFSTHKVFETNFHFRQLKTVVFLTYTLQLTQWHNTSNLSFGYYSKKWLFFRCDNSFLKTFLIAVQPKKPTFFVWLSSRMDLTKVSLFFRKVASSRISLFHHKYSLSIYWENFSSLYYSQTNKIQPKKNIDFSALVKKGLILVLSFSFAYKSQKQYKKRKWTLKRSFTVLINFLRLELFRIGIIS